MTRGNKGNIEEFTSEERCRNKVCPDHIHMLVSIPPQMSVSGFKGYLKDKSPSNISEMGKREICIPKPRILVQEDIT